MIPYKILCGHLVSLVFCFPLMVMENLKVYGWMARLRWPLHINVLLGSGES